MNADEATPDEAEGGGAVAVSWTVQPWRRNRPLGIAVALLVLAVTFGVRVVFGSMGWAAMALVLLTLSVARFYLPTRYALNAHGARMQGPFGTVEREWSAFRAWFVGTDGVLLSPFTKPSRLAFTRGIFLPFDDHRDEVLAAVEAFLGPRSHPDG